MRTGAEFPFLKTSRVPQWWNVSNLSSGTCMNAQMQAHTKKCIVPSSGEVTRSIFTDRTFSSLTSFQRHSAISAPPSLSALDDDPWGQTCSSAERWKWLLNALINPRYEIFLLKVDSLDYRLWVIERETAQLWLWDFLIAEFDVYDKEPHLANCAWKKNTFNYIFSLKCGFSQTFQRTQHK